MNRPIRILATAMIAWAVGAQYARAIQIIAPAAGITVTPGASLVVRVNGDPNEQLTDVAITLGTEPVAAVPVVGLTTFEATVQVPQTAVGPLFIVAVGVSAAGRTAIDFIPVTVDAGPLKKLFVAGPTVLTRIGQVFDVKVTGLFVDGVVRDLTRPDLGTTYSTTDATVLAVHPTGLIQARKKGYADLIVASRGQTTRLEVTVAAPDPPDNGIPVPDPGPDQTVSSQAAVTLSGAASHDPDGDPIAYEWRQVDGRLVTLARTNTTTLQFVAPRVTSPHTLTFSLTVRDAKGASSFPATVRVVVQP